MTDQQDRLFELLPFVYQERDATQGWPLRDLLRVVNEQVDVVENDIEQLYDNWFIETAEDWAVRYLAALVGWRPVTEAGQPGPGISERDLVRNKILVPRREVANTIGHRRRKGALALLEVLAHDVAGWPARAVEFYRLLQFAQGVNHVRLDRGRTVDLRFGDALDRLHGPFDELAHSVDVRRVRSRYSQGRFNLRSVGVFVWRIRSYPIKQAPAYLLETVGSRTSYTFSVLGNGTPLYVAPLAEDEPTDIAGELNVPTRVRRRAFRDNLENYYGPGKSLMIWTGRQREPVASSRIVAADLSGWTYRPRPGTVAVDPELGRMTFPPGELKQQRVWVRYRYGFSADIGGGEYRRELNTPDGAKVYRVGEGDGEHSGIAEALDAWQHETEPHAIIEIQDSRVYVEQLAIELGADQRLELRAANECRPTIRLMDFQTSRRDSLSVTGLAGSCFILDGFLVAGRGVQVEGDLGGIVIRHTTLVPGWTLDRNCEPQRPLEPSIDLDRTTACLVVEHSIIGSIQVNQDEVKTDPLPIHISDSVLDATANDREALGAPSWPMAHARLTIERSTVFGDVKLHSFELAENSIFMGGVHTARRQVGCMRFCYVSQPCRTPRRYHCQPDLVHEALRQLLIDGELTEAQYEIQLPIEQQRVRPVFTSSRYGTPSYSRLSDHCADEIWRGADDESEMGVFHDLFEPQRHTNLQARIAEYTPAGTDAGIIYTT